jgi:hypothetical protein
LDVKHWQPTTIGDPKFALDPQHAGGPVHAAFLSRTRELNQQLIRQPKFEGPATSVRHPVMMGS